MMKGWYHYGPGKEIIKTGTDFLHFQTSSEGYYSVVKGPKEKIGDFKLEKIDLDRGYAKVFSTTPFNRDMERGVLIGGMKAPNDLDYIEVNNNKDINNFEIIFYK